ncbi:lysylphosphatidylglycerol synthase transmembrane domain-containing protein [Spirosoma utsteinense]|uniref:TIGR00374 family protein n=1 Tax=Spirosoma utsteinense TaxID=2585773 RepID=A0ABR6W2V7_9BACT|nr:lysylphosphatidylglycerol synthase transmembrane domain-containing protein [Spirosoma utsteinense]MBC3783781.1 hypothetical protein [Spirosoma utsteinense]MBC3790075.1 hypothetical protein [Spirosoma utsteinense]
MSQFFGRVLPFLVAVLLLIYVSKDIQFYAIQQQFRQADYRWICLVFLVSIGSFFCRGIRWQQALLALGHHPSIFRATVALTAGTIASMIIPGSGEVTRCATLQRTDHVPFSHGVGSVVAERVLDLFMLVLVLLLSFALELSRMQTYLAGLSFTAPNKLLGLITGLVVLSIVLLYWLYQFPVIREHPFTIRIIGFSRGLWEGIIAIRRLPNPGFFVFLTLLNQLLSLSTIYFLLLSVSSTHSLPPTATLTVLAVASLGGLAVPTQGGIGTYHFLVSRALVLYGLSTTEGALLATFMHAVGFGFNLLFSSLSFLIVPVLVQQRKQFDRPEPDA